jgi:hypothetical protein
MTSAAALVEDLSELGIRLELADGGMLAVEPAGRLTPEIRAKLRANKPALVAYLRARQPANQTAPSPRRPAQPRKTVYWRPEQVLTLVATVRAQLGGQKSHSEALELSLLWLEFQHQIILGEA